MTPFTVLEGRLAVLDRANIDTDQIIPGRFLRKPRSDGYDNFLFHDLRRDEPGFPALAGCAALLAGANFGCGSSREGAVYALVDAGLRCVIAPSFGDIFAANAAKNGLLTVTLAEPDLAALRQAATLTIDLPRQLLRTDTASMTFEIDGFRKRCLLEGLDDFGLTATYAGQIAAWEQADAGRRPWARPAPG